MVQLPNNNVNTISTLVYPARRSIVASAILLDRLMNLYNLSPTDPIIKQVGCDVREKINSELLRGHCEALDNNFSLCPRTDIKIIRIN